MPGQPIFPYLKANYVQIPVEDWTKHVKDETRSRFSQKTRKITLRPGFLQHLPRLERKEMVFLGPCCE